MKIWKKKKKDKKWYKVQELHVCPQTGERMFIYDDEDEIVEKKDER